MRRSIVLGAILIALALPSSAQAPQATQVNIRGKIVKFADQMLTVKPQEGANATITMAPNFMVRTLVKKKLADIHPGDFVGSAAMPGEDGKLHAVEVHFFPANAPIPERQFPWDLRPGSLMTNAHVIGLAKASEGQTLSVDYKNGTAQIIVDPTTPVVAPAPNPGSAQDLKRGKSVFLIATKAADGTLTANSVTVEKNGIKPPM